MNLGHISVDGASSLPLVKVYCLATRAVLVVAISCVSIIAYHREIEDRSAVKSARL